MSALWMSLLIVGEVVTYVVAGIVFSRGIARRRWPGLAEWVGPVEEIPIVLVSIVFCWWAVLGAYLISRGFARFARYLQGPMQDRPGRET